MPIEVPESHSNETNVEVVEFKREHLQGDKIM